MKIIKVRSDGPQVALSCLGGCLLLFGWAVVGVLNVFLMSRYDVEPWQEAIVGIVWVFSAPVCGIAWLKWRGRRHSKAFDAMEAKMTAKTREQLRKHPPESGGI